MSPCQVSTVPQPIALDTTEEQSVTAYQEETGYEDYGDYQEEQVYTDQDTNIDNTMALQGAGQEKGTLHSLHQGEGTVKLLRTMVTH